jgi:p-hydroxybenzoate 3-monooxygenase
MTPSPPPRPRERESSTVVIVGGGVSGLTAAILLRTCGIDAVVLERRSRSYVEERQRAGLVEYRAVRMFERWGLGDVLRGFPGENFMEIRVDGQPRLLGESLPGLADTGRTIPQQALVRGLIAALLADGADLRFEAADVALHHVDGERPLVTYTGRGGREHEIACDFVAGCDGDRGISAASIPADAGEVHAYDYGIWWLTILADASPPERALMAVGERGFAAQFARGPKASRFYLHVAEGDTAADWPQDRIWAELKARLHAPGLPAGPITATEVFPLRGSIREPMSYGRLYLLGDAAHIIPPMGAKGMNLALFDAEVFATAVRDFTANGDETGLRGYSATCLERTWRYQEFSNWLTDMMHGASGAPGGGGGVYRQRIMRARLERVLSSDVAARYYAEMFTGLG